MYLNKSFKKYFFFVPFDEPCCDTAKIAQQNKFSIKKQEKHQVKVNRFSKLSKFDFTAVCSGAFPTNQHSTHLFERASEAPTHSACVRPIQINLYGASVRPCMYVVTAT